MKSVLSMVLLSILLSGCAGPPRWVWKHPQRSDAQMREDLEACRRQAHQGMPGMPLMTPKSGSAFYEERQDLIRNCMEAQGYYYDDVDQKKD